MTNSEIILPLGDRIKDFLKIHIQITKRKTTDDFIRDFILYLDKRSLDRNNYKLISTYSFRCFLMERYYKVKI